MPRTATALLPPGSVLAHYRLEEPLGEGAMGTVYRAHDEGLDRTVAVKVLRPGTSAASVREDRFFREARAAARVSHPNLTHVYYVGGDGSQRFFAMEYVRGASLDRYVDENGPPDLETALDILVQAASGLAAAHEAGIVHRDVKPSNLILRPDGVLKITDFGLSKSLHADVHISHDDTMIGTPTYMSPEQCRSQPVDPRTDVYSLGLTGWALLAGRVPYPGPSLGEVLHDQLNTPLPSLCAVRPDVPEELDRALRRMCAKDPARRPAGMHEVVEMLEACRPRAVHPAPVAARAVALGIDLVATLVVWAAVTVAVRRAAGHDIPDGVESVGVSLLGLLLVVGAELRHGLSLGKWFLSLRVRAADGSRPRRRALWLRGLLRFPGLVLWATGLPLLLPALDLVAVVAGTGAVVAGIGCFYAARGRTLSDLLTRTRVTYDVPPDEREVARPRAARGPRQRPG